MVENGHYFLSNHGRYTEVSPILYHFTRLHAIATMALHPFLIPAVLVLGSIRWGELQRQRRQTPGPGDGGTRPQP